MAADYVGVPANAFADLPDVDVDDDAPLEPNHHRVIAYPYLLMFHAFGLTADAHQAGSTVGIMMQSRDVWMRRHGGLEAAQQSAFHLLERGYPDPAFSEYATGNTPQEPAPPAACIVIPTPPAEQEQKQVLAPTD